MKAWRNFTNIMSSAGRKGFRYLRGVEGDGGRGSRGHSRRKDAATARVGGLKERVVGRDIKNRRVGLVSRRDKHRVLACLSSPGACM